MFVYVVVFQLIGSALSLQIYKDYLGDAIRYRGNITMNRLITKNGAGRPS